MWKRFSTIAILGVFVFLLYLVFDKVAAFDYKDVLEKTKAVPGTSLMTAVAFTALGYLSMSGYDWMGQRFVKRVVSWPKTLLVSFYSYALGLNVGVSWLSCSAVRFKMYQSWGYKPGEIAKLITFASISFWIGLACLSGVALSFSSFSFNGAYPIPDALVKPIGMVVCLASVLYLFACYKCDGKLNVRGRTFELPTFYSGLGQIGLAGIDLLFASLALFVLIPDQELSFFAFLTVYCLAFFGGLLSNAPGGIGVFETIFILFLPTQLPKNDLLAALVVYRAVYFLLPLGVACLLFAVMEGRSILGKMGDRLGSAQTWLSAIAPRGLSALVFAGGATLLVTGSLPVVAGETESLRNLIPLPVVEISHFVGSLIGLGMLFLAYAIKRKLDSAYYLSLIGLGLAAPVSLLRGDGLLVFGLLLGMALIMAPCRRYFYRKSSLLNLSLKEGNVLAILLTVTSAIYLGFVAFEYDAIVSVNWWEFELDDQMPRFLRVSLAVALVGGFLAALQLIRSPRVSVGERYEDCSEEVADLLQESDVAATKLALLGDKRIFFNSERTAFIMFTVKGRTWISMGDPVGEVGACHELIKDFKELCDEYCGVPIFYQTSKEYLHNYVDLGLKPVKVGEVARVRLSGFTLQGSRRQSMRSRLRRVEKKGCVFEVLSQKDALLNMPRLRKVSDEWLKSKNVKEKGFSLGYFEERYLSNFRFGVVRMDGEIVAFANLWETGTRSEVSIDLMRYTSKAPPSVMEFLFVKIIEWAEAEGYVWFDLRVAPLSGIDASQSAPVWYKAFDLAFNHGGSFYNFRGLRDYKQRFDPTWDSTYIASPGGWRLPRATAELTWAVSARPKENTSIEMGCN